MERESKQLNRFGLAPAIWCVGIGLIINGLVLAINRSSAPGFPMEIGLAGNVQAAPALTGGLKLNDGTYLLPAQLGRSDWGFILADPAHHVLAVYRILPSASRIRLMAVRDYKYDLMLKDFNNSSPTPYQVKKMETSGKTAH